MIGPLPPWPSRANLVRLFGTSAALRSANPGLVFDRYLPIWGQNGIDKSADVMGDLQAFIGFAKGGDRPLLDDVLQRMEAIAGPGRSFACDWRFVTGLGTHHPLENGFSFNRNLGVPSISGSSVKGLCRAAAVLEGLDPVKLSRLFGPDVESPSLAAGDLVFYEALPLEWPRLEVDIANCHHPGYYAGRKPTPVETESPIPIHFLTVAAGTRFVFWLDSRQGLRDDIEEGFRLLKSGFSVLGLGAKTAVGYGTFSESSLSQKNSLSKTTS